MPSRPYEADSLARSVRFFPVVGLVVGGGAALLHLLLAPHLPRLVAALSVVLYFILVTGGLHEDGLADAADGFGGGAGRENILIIMRDSRIGTFGGLALTFSLVARVIMIASLPLSLVAYYLTTASVLSRWTVLPLGYFLSPAHPSTSEEADGQGARIARHTSTAALIFGTLVSIAIAITFLKEHALAPFISVALLTFLTGAYYRKRIGGTTGDCFGATIQLAEISCYLCGAWIA